MNFAIQLAANLRSAPLDGLFRRDIPGILEWAYWIR
jgi:hypothetical protein